MGRGGLILVVALLAMSAWCPASPALAHGAVGGALTVVQLLGHREVAVTIQPTRQIPGPLLIEVRLRGGDTLPLVLRATSAERWSNATNQAIVRPLHGDRSLYLVQLQVDRAGAWELELREGDADAEGTPRAIIPFTVALPATQMQPPAVGFGGAGLLLLATIMAALGARRAWAAALVVPGGLLTLVALTIALTLAAQQSLTPPARTQGPPGYVAMALRLDPPAPIAGQTLTLDLVFTDGGTGLPADDLAPQHDALLHLVLISADGASFQHLHPSRVAAGRYRVEIVPERPGAYTAYAELARVGGGPQLVSQGFHVGGQAQLAANPPGLGRRQIGGLTVDVQAGKVPLRAGEPRTLVLTISADGQPVPIEPWLGMPGHMIIRSNTTFGHLHATIGSPADGSAQLSFVYTFPEPGVYWLWAQFGAEGTIATVPIRLVVAA